MARKKSTGIGPVKRARPRSGRAYGFADDIFEAVRQPLLLLDSELRVTSANRAFYERFLADPEETEGSHVCDLVGGQWDITELRALLQGVLKEKKLVTDFKVVCEVPNIGRRTMLLNAHEIVRNKRRAASGERREKEYGDTILLSIEDITEQKMTEVALHGSLQRYRSYIELTGELGWTTNADGEVVEDLPSWRKYTGQTFEQMKGWGWSKAIHQDDLAYTLKKWKEAVSKKSKYEIEYRIRGADGNYRHFMVRGVPVFMEGGGLREWVGTCIDITDRKKSEEEIKRLNLQLNRKVGDLETSNKDWEMFSHAVSHELRSPLFLIDGFSLVLLTDYSDKLDVEGRKQLTTIREMVKQMRQLLEDLFAFYRAVATEIRTDMLDMEALARQAFEELKPGIGNRDIRFEVKSLAPCRGDSPLIRQVFLNLLANAIKFTRPKEIALIEVGGVEKGEEIEFYVKDNGVGFDMKLADGLFNIFQRLHSGDDFEGTGAGLAIVRRIIEKHGGRVRAEGKPGKGAIFYFSLAAGK